PGKDGRPAQLTLINRFPPSNSFRQRPPVEGRDMAEKVREFARWKGRARSAGEWVTRSGRMIQRAKYKPGACGRMPRPSRDNRPHALPTKRRTEWSNGSSFLPGEKPAPYSAPPVPGGSGLPFGPWQWPPEAPSLAQRAAPDGSAA